MVELSKTTELAITQQWCPWNEPVSVQEQSGISGSDNNSNLPPDVDLACPLPSPLPDCLGNYGSLPDYQGSGLFHKSCGFAGDFYLLQDLSPTEEQGDDGSTENVFFGENDDDGVVIDDDDAPGSDDDDDDGKGATDSHDIDVSPGRDGVHVEVHNEVYVDKVFGGCSLDTSGTEAEGDASDNDTYHEPISGAK